jgi:ABC-type multidrug transport system fused ATPase/permease subunit
MVHQSVFLLHKVVGSKLRFFFYLSGILAPMCTMILAQFLSIGGYSSDSTLIGILNLGYLPIYVFVLETIALDKRSSQFLTMRKLGVNEIYYWLSYFVLVMLGGVFAAGLSVAIAATNQHWEFLKLFDSSFLAFINFLTFSSVGTCAIFWGSVISDSFFVSYFEVSLIFVFILILPIEVMIPAFSLSLFTLGNFVFTTYSPISAMWTNFLQIYKSKETIGISRIDFSIISTNVLSLVDPKSHGFGLTVLHSIVVMGVWVFLHTGLAMYLSRTVLGIQEYSLSMKLAWKSLVSGSLMRKLGPMKVVLKSITKNYGKRGALVDFSIEMDPGNIYAVLGRSGAGKTTLLSILSGAIKPTSGEMSVLGYGIEDNNSFLRQNIGICEQDDVLINERTAIEHISLYGTIRGVEFENHGGLRQYSFDLLAQVGLEEYIDKKISNFSGGTLL